MARGRAANYDAQHDLILARATELFALHGYASATMNQVAEACNMSKPTLYHYFRDKDALLVEMTLGHVQHLHAIVVDVMALALPPQARLEQLILRFVNAYADAQHAHRVLTEDTRFLPSGDRERVLGYERKVVAAFAKTIVALRPDLNEARLAKPMTMLLFGMINWMFTWLRRDGALNHQAMAPLVVSLFLGGLPAVASNCNHGRPPRLSRTTRPTVT